MVGEDLVQLMQDRKLVVQVASGEHIDEHVDGNFSFEDDFVRHFAREETFAD